MMEMIIIDTNSIDEDDVYSSNLFHYCKGNMPITYFYCTAFIGTKYGPLQFTLTKMSEDARQNSSSGIKIDTLVKQNIRDHIIDLIVNVSSVPIRIEQTLDRQPLKDI